MSQAAAALRAAVAALLAAQGEIELADVVRDADVEVLPPETWTLGPRTVQAHRVAIALDAAAFAGLGAAPERIARLRAAFEAAMRSPETELADLALLLRLPALGVAWGHAYRDSSPREAEHPSEAAVLGGASALLAAKGDHEAAAMLARAELESAEVPGSGRELLRRWVARLDPADLARAQRQMGLGDRIRGALRDAATRATEVVASVELAAGLAQPADTGRDPESLLTRALVAHGAAVVAVSRTTSVTVLAWVCSGELGLIELTAAPRATSSGETRVRRVVVDSGAVADDEAADRLGAVLCGEGAEGKRPHR